MKIYLVRHGRTLMNLKKLLQGQGGYGLLEEGREDARRAAEALAGKGVEAIYSSDQQRARETAAILKSGIGFNGRVRVSRRLREIDFGTMTGRPVEEVRRLCPEYGKDAAFTFPGGESFVDLQVRALRWLEALERRRPARAAAVVTHGGWIRTLLVALRGEVLDRCLEGSIPHGLVARIGPGRSLDLLQPVTIFPVR
jgi:probable phosphoglycerate mutase